MQTHLRDEAYNIALPVGFAFEEDEVQEPNLIDSGYLPTGNPSPDGRLRLINLWGCPTCHHYNFGEVTFDGPRILAIGSVPIVPASVARVQYMQRDAQRLIEP